MVNAVDDPPALMTIVHPQFAAAPTDLRDGTRRRHLESFPSLQSPDEGEHAEYEPSYNGIDQHDPDAVKDAEQAYVAALARRIRRAEQKAREKK